jgi:hypothetical protein
MPVRFLINPLKSGVDQGEYERWVQERDHALVRSRPNCLSYTEHRIRGRVAGAPDVGWQYIERIEVRNIGLFRLDLKRWPSRVIARSIATRQSPA